jgi:hypothetical protein
MREKEQEAHDVADCAESGLLNRIGREEETVRRKHPIKCFLEA